MKRKLLTFITLAVAVSAFAQIEIKQSGRIMVGSHQSAPPAQPRNPNFGGGDVDFECSQSINLDKCTVESGAKMSIEGKMIKLGAGFKVEKGGILKTQNKK